MTLKGWRVVKPQHNQSINQILFSEKNKKKYFKLLSAENITQSATRQARSRVEPLSRLPHSPFLFPCLWEMARHGWKVVDRTVKPETNYLICKIQAKGYLIFNLHQMTF